MVFKVPFDCVEFMIEPFIKWCVYNRTLGTLIMQTPKRLHSLLSADFVIFTFRFVSSRTVYTSLYTAFD